MPLPKKLAQRSPKLSSVSRFFYRVLLASLLLISQVGQAQSPAKTFTNPLLANGPDPWVIRKNGYYYYLNTMGNRLAIRKTKALSQLAQAEPTTVWTPPATGPNARDIWAPELHYLAGKWYLYYTATDAQHPSDETRGVFVLENSAADPTTGTWVDRGKVNTKYPGLDGSVFEDRGQLYFLYSAYVGPQSVLCLAPLQNPWTLETSQEVIIAAPTFAWEKGGGRQILEGPEFLRGKKGQVFIVYSASACWDDNYSLGMLTAGRNANLLQASSWTKSPTPVFQKSVESGVYGPGHNSFTTSPDGRQDWIVYHAKDAPNGKCEARSLRIQPFTWNPDGTPHFGAPLSANNPIPSPSGE